MARTVKCVLLALARRKASTTRRIRASSGNASTRTCRGSLAALGKHQVMLMNEYRLTPIDPKARKRLVEEMEKFFFGGGLQTPKEFVISM